MPQKKKYYVYILTNRWRTVLYVGVTNNLVRRCFEHKSGKGGGFTRRYNVDRLVYLETFGTIADAIRREKQLKAGSRKRKITLIESVNPEWSDLSQDTIIGV